MMKKIVLKNYSSPDKSHVYTKFRKYSIYLGNEKWQYFNSKIACENFIAETNKFLNENVFHLNRIYSDVYAEYRQYWYQNLSDIDVLRSNLKQIERSFDKLYRAYTEQNVFVFQNLLMILADLQEVIELMITNYKEKNKYFEVKNLQFIAEQVIFIQNKVDAFCTQNE